MTTTTTKTTPFKVEQMTTTTMTLLGGSPWWDHETDNLYWTDVMTGQIFRMDTTTHYIWTAKILGETYISFIIPVAGTTNQYVVGAGKRLLLITWDGVHTMATIVRILTELPFDGVRFNDAKTDSHGRLYLGTMISEETGTVFDLTKRLGSLYRFTMTDGLVEVKTKVGLSSGMAFNDRTSTFYYVDSYDLNIKQWHWDVKTGSLTSEKIFTDLSTYGTPKMNFPHGMTIDLEGNLYVAMFGGSRILKFNTTTGKVMSEITLPVPQVTSMTFGDETLETMYVTTAGMDVTTTQTYPAGYMFKVTGTGIHGTPTTKFMTTV